MNYNQEQMACINDTSHRIVCMAGAGAGKTATMLGRIKRIIEGGCRPDGILVLTFTRAAALEMKERYEKDSSVGIHPNFSTFHAFCYDILRKDEGVRMSIGFSKAPTVISDAKYNQISRKIKNELGFKISKKRLESGNLTYAEQDTYKLYLKRLNVELVKNNYVTYDSMSKYITDLFTSDDRSIARYKSQYHTIIVDEFQDTSPDQFDFVKSFEKSDIYVCGDLLQAIYGFRGATSEIMENLVDDDSWKVLKLQNNYRSDIDICQYANDATDGIDDKYKVLLNPISEEDGIVNEHFYTRDTYEHYPDSVKKSYRDILKELHGTTAILARSNREVDAIQWDLKLNNIRFNGIRKDEILKILECAVDINVCLEYIVSIMKDDKYCTYLQLESVGEFKDMSPEDVIHYIINHIDDSDKMQSTYTEILQVQKVLQDQTMPYTWKYTSILHYFGEIDIPSVFNLNSNADVFRMLIKFFQDERLSNLYVGTIHSVKGLEFDNVILLGVGSREFPLYYDENINLYYVGITRAKHRLEVYKNE